MGGARCRCSLKVSAGRSSVGGLLALQVQRLCDEGNVAAVSGSRIIGTRRERRHGGQARSCIGDPNSNGMSGREAEFQGCTFGRSVIETACPWKIGGRVLMDRLDIPIPTGCHQLYFARKTNDERSRLASRGYLKPDCLLTIEHRILGY